jgi:hypothetical protein
MAKSGTITMSMREIDRLKTIQAVVDGNLKPMSCMDRIHVRREKRLDGSALYGCTCTYNRS